MSGHFLEGEVFDLALGKLLEQVAALAVHQDVIPDLELFRSEGIGDDADLVLVRAQGHHRAGLVEDLLEDDDLALDLVAGRLDDVEPLVEHELLAGLDVLDLERRVQVHLHLAALREDVDGGVLVDGQVDAVGGRRRAELVDFLAKRGDLLARLVEGVDELLVLIERLDQLAVGLAQLVLEDHRLFWRVLDLLAQPYRLGLERPHVGLEILHLHLVLGETPAVIRVGHGKELGEPLHAFGGRLAARVRFLLELLHVRPFLSR